MLEMHRIKIHNILAIKFNVSFKETLYEKGTIMSDNQAEFGYSPHNLRFVLKFTGVTQIYAGEIISKARSTFSRYLLDIENENHVSMSHRDWSLLLEKLKFPRQSFRVNRQHMIMRNTLNKINSLDALPAGSRIFVGARNGTNGRLLTHITDEQSLEEFKEMMKSRFQTDGITRDDLQCFTIRVENLFEDYMKGLVKKIGDLNEVVFSRIIDYDTDGVITNFKAFFDRIIRSEYNDYQGLSRDILRINTHFMKEFKNTEGYYRNPNFNHNQQRSPQYLSDINQVEESFSSALNTLVMYMVSEYYGDKKKYHQNNKHISDVIEKMYAHLSLLFKVEFNRQPKLFEQYLIEKAFNKPDEFEQIQNVLEYQLSATDFARMVRGKLINNDDYFEHGHYNSKSYELRLFESCELSEYFERLTKLFGILNLVCDMNEKLAISSANGENADAELQAQSEFKILLKLPSNTTALATA